MLERLSRNIEGKFWKGPDIATSEDIVLEPGPLPIAIPVTIFENSLPRLTGLSVKALRYYVSPSVRSRLVQWGGLDIHDSAASTVAQSILRSKHQDLNGNFENSLKSFVIGYNRGQRPIKLPASTPFFRFYVEIPNSRLRDEQLRKLINDRRVVIDGEFNKDWGYSYTRNAVGEKHIDGIYVRIENARYWIPPSKDNKPLEIDPYAEDYRAIIGKLLAPIPRVKKEILWIGQTVKISIPSEIEAVLDKLVVHDIDQIDFERAGLQINSRLLDGGRTNWPVRVEVLSPTIPEKIPNFVHLHFAKNGHQ